jgi:hypothetical protein
MARWRNYFSQILNVHGVSDVRQVEIHTAEPLVPEPSAFEIEIAIEKLKRHKSPGIDQIPAELIKAGGSTIRCAIHKLIIAIWNKEELPREWKESIIVPIHKKGDNTDCNNYRGISLLPTTYKILSNILLSRLIPYVGELLGITNVDSDAIGQLLIIYSVFIKYLRKNGNTMRQCISSLQTSRKLMIQLLYNILIEFCIPKKLVRLIKMCLTETYSRVRVGNNLSEMFPIRNGLKQGDALSPLLFNFALEYAIRRVQMFR